MESLPQDVVNNILEILTYVATAAIGYIARLLTRRKTEAEKIHDANKQNN